MMIRSRRRTAWLSLLSLVLAMCSAFAAFADNHIRLTAEGIGGFSTSAEAAPSGVEFFAQFIPIPVDPGEPQFEITQSFSVTDLDVGPTGRAAASSVWPGAGVGDGFGAVCECDQTYPIKAQANYPGETTQQDASVPGQGGGMTAFAEGLDVVATADTSDNPAPELMTFGSVASRSESHVFDGEVVSTAYASVGDVSLLGGLVTIDSVVTDLAARSDTEVATTGGATAVTGLTILGTGYTIDQDGLRAVEEEPDDDDGDGDGGTTPGGLLGDVTDVLPDAVSVLQSLVGSEALREEAGISVQLVEHVEDINGANGSRVAEGLRVIIETAPLRSVLDIVPFADIVGGVPDPDLQAQLFFLLGLRPRIDFVIAAGRVRAAANAPFVFTPPPLPPPAPPPAPAPTATAAPPPSTSPPSSPTTTTTTTRPSGGITTSSGSAGTPVQAPQVSPPQQQPVAAPPVTPVTVSVPNIPLFDGLSPFFAVLAVLFAGAGAWGLTGLTQTMMIGTATAEAGNTCALTNRELHDLRFPS